MVLNDPSATINALLFALGVVLTLMFCRRGDSRHRPWISRLAWLLTVILVLFRWRICAVSTLIHRGPLSGPYIIFLSVLVAVRGNVARLVDHLRQ